MTKFSIVVPVYNTEKYLKKCLDSIVNQTYKDFELIIVNDGSTDGSKHIIDQYEKKYDNVVVINQVNQGLSAARNNGIKNTKGEYFLLVDSDDYIDRNLLEKLKNSVDNNPDLVRFQICEIGKNKIEYKEKSFYGIDGKNAFSKIVNFHYVELACCYLYKTSFFKINKFEFKINKYHEDFGLIPLVIITSDKVNILDFVGYNYVQHENSIMNNSDYEKKLKKAYDTLEQYEDLIKYDGGKIYKSFLSNSVILKLKDLKKRDYDNYLKLLRKNNCFDYILDDTISRKIKKFILKINPKIYLKIVR